MISFWNSEESGVLTSQPLLLRACRSGRFGSFTRYSGGCVYQATFTYLCGNADADFFFSHPQDFHGKWLICMSASWAGFLRTQPREAILRRELMRPMCAPSQKPLSPLPAGYTIVPFTPEIFARHPFNHGANYNDFDDFASHGAGAVALYKGEIVAAASSYLSFENEVELDVFTDESHRKKGLSNHCVAEMMRQCANRHLIIHWDAQNLPSAALAKGHGFVSETEYAVYVLGKHPSA